MRLRALAVSAVLVPALVTLSACAAGTSTQSNSSDTGTSSSSTTGQTDIATTSTSAPTTTSSPVPAGPEIPADTAVAAPVARDEMPQATGAFGEKPTITVPKTAAPQSLQRVILSEGDGPQSKAGDTVVVNYLGQVWGGQEFDNSYDRKAVFTTQIGVARPQVVAGWNVGLQGVKQGSRVLLSFPAWDGYGAAGSPPKIPGGASLIFVIDVVGVYAPNAAADLTATPQDIPAGWPTASGKLGEVPTITVPKSLPDPAQPGVTLVAKGHGAPAQAGDVLVQYVATAWDGSQTQQSWPDPTGKNPQAGTGPQAFPISSSSPFAALIGVPIGSRVLMRTPANSTNGVPSVAWVIDLITQLDVAPASATTSSAG
jgi:peptidylprolyl isomerase